MGSSLLPNESQEASKRPLMLEIALIPQGPEHVHHLGVPSVCTAAPMQPEVRVDSCTSPGTAPERILAPCAGQGLTFNLHEASRCTQPWLQPMHQCTSTPSIPVVRLITSGDIQYQAIYTVVCIRCISGVISADMSYQQRLLLRNDWAVAAEIGQTTSLRGSVSAFIPPLSPCRRPLNYRV